MRTAFLAAVAGLIAVAGCSDAGTPTFQVNGGDQISAIELSSTSASLVVGKSAQVLAAVKDVAGNLLEGHTITWSTSDDHIATVSSSGLVTALAPGSATIKASSDGVTGSLALTVTDPVVASVTLNSTSVAVIENGTYQLTATPRDSDGAELHGRSISWTSSDDAVATVSPSGVVKGVKAGHATVSARSEGKKGDASVDVSPIPTVPVSTVSVSLNATTLVAGQTTQATATTKDASGNTLTGRSITWSSSNTSIATVNASGLVTSVGAGSATITATSEGKNGSANLTVTVAPVATVTVTPATSSVQVGAMRQLTAALKDANGATLTGRPIAWTTSNASLATVNATGVVTGIAPGSVTIVATSEGKTGSATVTITQVPVATVAVTPSSGSVVAGNTYQLTATTKDANGTILTGRTITWTSSSNATATVNASGLVTAVAAGSATITATSEGKTGTATVTVTSSGGGTLAQECASPKAGWIFCDDFETDRTAQYFEYDNASGGFVRSASIGMNGSSAMRAHFNASQVNAGSLKLAFGRTPDAYMRPIDAGTANYREIYWRVYLRNEASWTGGAGDKLSRAIVFASSSWAEAAIAHVWGADAPNVNQLAVDPASGTDAAGTLKTTTYNDNANLTWLGSAATQTSLFDASHVGQWYCVEAHVRLNTAGQSNGVFDLWLNGQLEAQRTGLNWLGSYNAYGINAVLLENYWNNGSPKAQERYLDNFVVSTQPIGCGSGTTPPPNPAPVSTVSVGLTPSSVSVGLTALGAATLRDASGNLLSGRTVTWASSNPNVASVSSTTGLVTALAAGTATISATSEGQNGTAVITVTPAVPPPSGSCSNEPTGMSVITNSAWNSLPSALPNRNADGWGYEYTATNLSILQDATAPQSPNGVLRTTFPAGMGGGSGPATFDNTFANRKTIYVCMWLRRSAGWSDNGNAGTKHFFVYSPYAGAANSTHVYVGINGDMTHYFGLESNNQSAVPNIDYSGAVEPAFGGWHRYEYLFASNSTSASDGSFTAWRDGQQIMFRGNMKYFPTGVTPAFNMVQWAPTYGGGTNPVPKTQYIDVDHWYISGK